MGTFVTSAATLIKAGANVSSDMFSGNTATGLTGEDIVENFISGATCLVNTIARINYSDTYATLNDDVKFIFADTVASLAAIDCVNYDMSGYTSRFEAQGMIDVLRDSALRGLSLLKDKKTTTFIDGT